ncbi:MAG: sulfite exporter TauE/SafE family protein, partial [Betaproteobacteria bacterium]
MSSEIILLAVGAAVAGLIQGISGFAFSMIAMSIWVWGIEPQVATIMAVFGGLTGQILTAFTVRRGMRLAVLLPFLLGALVGVPLGVMVLPYLNPATFKLTLGGMLVIFCPAMLMAQSIPKITIGGRFADAIAGMIGGIMGGIGGFTGVIPSLWCTLRGFDKDLQRTIIQNFNLSALAVTMGAYLYTGAVTREMLPMFAVVAPALLLPSLLGARIYTGLSDAAFRRIVLILLTCSGLAMVASALSGVLR